VLVKFYEQNLKLFHDDVQQCLRSFI